MIWDFGPLYIILVPLLAFQNLLETSIRCTAASVNFVLGETDNEPGKKVGMTKPELNFHTHFGWPEQSVIILP